MPMSGFTKPKGMMMGSGAKSEKPEATVAEKCISRLGKFAADLEAGVDVREQYVVRDYRQGAAAESKRPGG